MIFTEFHEKNWRKPDFLDEPLLCPEYRVPVRNGNGTSESPAKSGKAEFYHAFLLNFISRPSLEELFKIVSCLTQQGVHPMPFQSVPETFAETPDVFCHGDESLGSSAGASAESLFFLSHICVPPHKDMSDLGGSVFKIGGTAESEVGDCRVGIPFHTFCEKGEGVSVKSAVSRGSYEILNGDHKTLPAESHLYCSPELAVRATLSFFDRPSIGIVEGDEPVFYMRLSRQLLQCLPFQDVQNIEQLPAFVFPPARGEGSDSFLKYPQSRNEQTVERG
ncbi:MAG: hypothetical protein GY757_23030, partial [bacterium]|nr:hypothetical protein [bacterium]